MPVRKIIYSLTLLHEGEGVLQLFFAMSLVMIDLIMRRQAVLSPAGCPKME
jgi:hypothetical protein